MQSWSFKLFEHDPDKPWIILSQRHITVEIEDHFYFYARAGGQWSHETHTWELDPYQPKPVILIQQSQNTLVVIGEFVDASEILVLQRQDGHPKTLTSPAIDFESTSALTQLVLSDP